MSRQREVVVKLHCEHEGRLPTDNPQLWIRDTLAGKECVKCYSFLESDV